MKPKIAIIAILFIALINFNSVVANEVEWEKTYGLDTYNIAYAIQPAENGYIIVGYTTPSFKDRVNGNADVYVIKIDENGNVQWEKTYGGDKWDAAYAIQPAENGYIVAGERMMENLSMYIYAIKIDENGNVQWEKTYGKGMARDICIAHGGGYVLTGYVKEMGHRRLCFIKIGDDGNVQWKKTYGRLKEEGNSIDVTQDGYIAAGITWSFGRSQDAYVIKVDENGDMQWQRAYGGKGIEGASSIKEAGNGYIIGGWKSPAQNSLIYVMKIAGVETGIYPVPSNLNLGKHKAGEKFTEHFYLRNTRNETQKWNITENIPWLDVEPKAGEGEANISVFVNTSSLKAGKYEGYIDVVTGEGIKTVHVELEIEKKNTPGFGIGIAVIGIILLLMAKRNYRHH